MLASLPDLLRLLVVPVFAWAAWRDHKTRRLPNRLWPPLLALGAVLLLWESAARYPFDGFGDRLFLVRVAVSLLFVAPLGYACWYLGGFGGADAKAVIVFAVLLPTYPVYAVPGGPALPLSASPLGVFSLTVLTNTVLVALAFPLALFAGNVAAGRLSPAGLLARPTAVSSLPSTHGRLFETREGFTRAGLDADALRMYLRWRGLTLAELRADARSLRDPATVGETHDPTDGAAHVGPATDGDRTAEATSTRVDPAESAATALDSADAASTPDDAPADLGSDSDYDDPWAAEAFLDAVPGTAYGTTPEILREGLEVAVDREEVWVSPGLPFVVPMFVGLLLAFTFGDVLFALLGAAGLV